jgi:hypothetical protein
MRFIWTLALATFMTLGAQPAQAQQIGVRAGVSADPDQFFIGGHVETPPIIDRLYLRPNVEVGFGDDVVFTAVNAEAIYRWTLRSPWRVYAGAGPAINFAHRDDDTDAEASFNVLGGLEHRLGWFVEAKFGVESAPDLKLTVGYTFR